MVICIATLFKMESNTVARLACVCLCLIVFDVASRSLPSMEKIVLRSDSDDSQSSESMSSQSVGSESDDATTQPATTAATTVATTPVGTTAVGGGGESVVQPVTTPVTTAATTNPVATTEMDAPVP